MLVALNLLVSIAWLVAIASARSVAVQQRDYNSYVAAQLEKTDHLPTDENNTIRIQWVSEAHIAYVAGYIARVIRPTSLFALCHGTRAGREQVWFRKHLAAADIRVQVWGTELSPTQAKVTPWTIAWDFHDVRPEWLGAADFVYSNALDHSYNASLALERWMSEVRPGGAVLLHWSAGHEKPDKHGKSATDLFGTTAQKLRKMISASGTMQVVDEIHLGDDLVAEENRKYRGHWRQRVYVVMRSGDALHASSGRSTKSQMVTSGNAQ